MARLLNWKHESMKHEQTSTLIFTPSIHNLEKVAGVLEPHMNVDLETAGSSGLEMLSSF